MVRTVEQLAEKRLENISIRAAKLEKEIDEALDSCCLEDLLVGRFTHTFTEWNRDVVNAVIGRYTTFDIAVSYKSNPKMKGTDFSLTFKPKKTLAEILAEKGIYP
jgi:hypothetical protein